MAKNKKMTTTLINQVSFPWVNRLGREVDHSLPSSTKAKNQWSYASKSPARLHGVDKDNFTFYVLLKTKLNGFNCPAVRDEIRGIKKRCWRVSEATLYVY
jgi:hypothetical protein